MALDDVDWPSTEEGWPLSPTGFAFAEHAEVGAGAFAKVMQGWCEAKQVHVAVKIMALENITTSMEEIQMEVRAMKLNRHENVLDLHCCFVVGSDLWLVMPLMEKGSCYYALRCLRKAGTVGEHAGFPEDIIATILRELLAGLVYIHGNHQIHRDIKAGNILLNSDGRVAIADFGVAGWTNAGDGAARGPDGGAGGGGGGGGARGGDGGGVVGSDRKTFVGTPCWMAPEVMEQQRCYNEKADIWSVGITALELAKGYAPYSKYPPMTVLLKTIREPPPTLKSYPVEVPNVAGAAAAAAAAKAAGPPLSETFSKFVARCLQKDPKMRPSAAELLNDPLLKKGIKSSKLGELLSRDVPSVGGATAVGAGASAAAGGAGATAGGGDGGTVLRRGIVPLSATEELAPGTTWVFPDEVKKQLGIVSFPSTGGVGGGGGLAPHDEMEGEDDDEEDTSIDALAAQIAALGGEGEEGGYEEHT